MKSVILKKEDDDWVKKCMEYEVKGPRPRGRPKRTWREVVEKDCQAHKLNKADAMDRIRWRKLIKDVRWSGWVWVGEFLLVPAYPGSPGSQAVKRLSVCVCVSVILNLATISLYVIFSSVFLNYYYYYAAVNMPCVGHEDNESQQIVFFLR